MQGTKRHRFNPWIRKIPWRRSRQPTLVFLPRESHGQRRLVTVWSEVKWKSLSCVRLFVTPWTVACQASLSRGFPRQEYWSCRLFLQGILPDQGLNSCIAGGFFYWWATREAHVNVYSYAYVCVYLYLYMQRKYLRVHTQNRVYLLEENLGRKGDF